MNVMNFMIFFMVNYGVFCIGIFHESNEILWVLRHLLKPEWDPTKTGLSIGQI